MVTVMNDSDRRFVCAIARRIVGDQDAGDVAQETLLLAHRNRDRFRGDASYRTWLYRIATNEALMQLRRNHTAFAALEALDAQIQPADLPQNLHAWPLDPARVALNQELHDQLEHALARLPASLRVVFVLREIEGLSTDETAAALGLGESAVKVRLYRARLRLRELLASYLATEGDEA